MIVFNSDRPPGASAVMGNQASSSYTALPTEDIEQSVDFNVPTNSARTTSLSQLRDNTVSVWALEEIVLLKDDNSPATAALGSGTTRSPSCRADSRPEHTQPCQL